MDKSTHPAQSIAHSLFHRSPGAHGNWDADAQKGVGAPKWTLSLDDEETVSGVALIPERLYVAARDGVLFAIGNR